MQKYAIQSIDLHLFFMRIMKEHSLFLEVGFLKNDTAFIKEASYFRCEFEKLLWEVVQLSNGLVSKPILESHEIVTQYTYEVEKKTERLIKIPINSNITIAEHKLNPFNCASITTDVFKKVKSINHSALRLLDGLICLKENILNQVLHCKLFTANYPLLIKHILREAKLYRSYLVELEREGAIRCESVKEVELFWNQIMMEHALFIRGLLDPTENELINTADNFVCEYATLLEAARLMTDKTMEGLTQKTLEETMKYRDFKEAGTKGITNCEIQALILPLLADHVLREANHYIRLLKS